MGLDDAALSVGREVVKHAVRAWLGLRREQDRRGRDLSDLLEVAVVDRFRRRDLARKLDDIGDHAARRLQPLYQVEFRDLPEHDRVAAVAAVGEALLAADLDDRTLFAADANPVKLARLVRSRVPRASEQAGLSEGAQELYQRVLDESCLALVSIVRQLPEFSATALGEVLDRMSSITAELERLPRASLDAPHGTNFDSEFRHRYLECVSAELDNLELFGIDLHRYQPRTQVSVAYFSLTVTSDNQPTRYGRGPADDDWFGRRRDSGATGVRVEAALSERQRTLLRGEAGSGKTTLLQWLAVTCARGGFTGPLAPWNGRVPFLIRLRSYADRLLPEPADFLADVGRMSAGQMPHSWVYRQLTSHGLLLVDGVDELVPSQRRGVRTWLEQLGRLFPELPMVVTSRPSAASTSWLDQLGFGSVLLEPMNPTDIAEFCRRWHRAIREATAHDSTALPCAPGELASYETGLLRNLDARRHLRALATNPLLCAMLCALNLDRHRQLPPDRMSLYAAALDLLVERRDAERVIPAAGQLRLDARTKLAILQHLAWRLTEAGRAELAFDDCVDHVARAIDRLPGLEADAETVLRHLVERSGVIRQPVVGRIDFVHRTFQEYLAGKEAAEDHLVDVLLRHAGSDLWRETIVMAAGHATPKHRAALLSGLLELADKRRPTQARRLRLLATACLETAHSVDPAVASKVDAALGALLPPRSTRETKSLAGAGDRVLGKLPDSLDELSDSAAAACVRTAALINGPAALNKLAGYATDPRHSVQAELAEMWRYFDAETYARKVLADAPLQSGWIVVGRREHVPLTRVLTQLKLLSIHLDDADIGDLDWLNGVPFLHSLRLQGNKPLERLTPLLAHPELARLTLVGGCNPANLDALSVLGKLERLMTSMGGVDSIRFVAEMPELREIHFFGLRGVWDLDPLTAVSGLARLSLTLHNVDPAPIVLSLSDLTDLMLFDGPFSGVADLGSLLPQLASLNLSRVNIGNPSCLADATRLQWINLSQTEVTDLRPIARLPKLQQIFLRGCQPGLDLSPLAELPRRAKIILDVGQSVQGLDIVRRRHRIQRFT